MTADFGTTRLDRFVHDVEALLDRAPPEDVVLAEGSALLGGLVAHDDWLPAHHARPDPDRYTQYLLHADPAGRFSVVSFVWGPGQATPVHDHRVWGLVGVLRGAEVSQRYARTPAGIAPVGEPERLEAGAVEAVSPSVGDIHRVANAFGDRTSISIHLYGADIGRVERATYAPDGTEKRFVSGYADARTLPRTTPREVRLALLARREIALLDLRDERDFAAGHPLFAAQLALDRIAIEAPARLPRRDVPIVLYGADDAEVEAGAAALADLGYTRVSALDGGLEGWRAAGHELFQDVNSYSKAFGELVEARRHTSSLAAPDVAALIEERADIAILDARRFEEYMTMSIPTGTSVPGAELVLRAAEVAPDPDTTIIVNCAGRTRSIIGAQSLINAGVPNRVFALRNGTIGWTLAGQTLDRGAGRRGELPVDTAEGGERARAVAYRAGVRRIDPEGLAWLAEDRTRTLYRFDVRTPEEYAHGHIPGFRSAPGGQLVQETDMAAPVRGARIVLADDRGARADMTASWLAQMGWEVLVLDGGFDGALERGAPAPLPPVDPATRYKRPYEGTDNAAAAMQAYLDWEYGLVDQLARDGTHGFTVL